MGIQSQVIINKPPDKIWKFITKPKNWDKWWGARLKSVKPGWENGATMIWEQGQSKLSSVVQQSVIEITSPFITNTIRLKALPDNKTLVEFEMAPRGGASFSDGGQAQKAKNDASLMRLKQAVE
jgi:uncharacterized protein YndB with AHSA1/START domain